MSTTKFCKDCEYSLFMYHVGQRACFEPSVLEPVDGGGILCEKNRMKSGDCGPEGRLFKQKEKKSSLFSRFFIRKKCTIRLQN